MADEPKSFAFRFADTSDEQSRLTVNMTMYRTMALHALTPSLLFERVPAKPLNRRQKARRFLANVKQTRLQRLHDWTTRKGAYCDSDW